MVTGASTRPGSPKLWRLAGQAHAENELGRTKGAVPNCDRGIEIDPIQASCWLDRGGALNELDQRDEANGSFAKALGRAKLKVS